MKASEETHSIKHVYVRALGVISSMLRNKYTLLSITILVSAISVYGFVSVKRGSILYRPITDPNNAVVISDALVRDSTDFEEFAYIGMHLPENITEKTLKKVRSVHTTLEEAGFNILSIANYPNFRFDSTTGVIHTDTYADTTKGFDVARWKQHVMSDQGVYGTLVEKDFSYLLFLISLEKGFDEVEVGRNIASFLEDRMIPKWEWYFTSNVEPKDPDLFAASYIDSRNRMYGALPLANFSGVAIGLFFGFLLLSIYMAGTGLGKNWHRKNKEGLKLAFIAEVLIVLALLWTRGAIGIGDMLGFNTRENVFTLLVYASTIVAGVSFHIHVFDGYREGVRNGKTWQSAKRFVNRFVQPLVILTALIAIANFLSLAIGGMSLSGSGTIATILEMASIDVRVIIELGVFSAIGVAAVWFLASVIYPLAIRKVGLPKSIEGTPGHAERLFVQLSKGCKDVVTSRWRYVVALISTTLIALAMYGWVNWLEVGSYPPDYIRGTDVHETINLLNEEDHLGFVTLDFLLVPKESAEGSLRDRDVVVRALNLQKYLEHLPDVRRTASVLDQVSHVSRELYGASLPPSSDAVEDVFAIVESDFTYLEFAHQFEAWNMGWRLTVTTDREATELGQVRADVKDVAADHGFTALPFGMNALYPEIDREIVEGKPLNALLGQLWVFIFIFLWFGVSLWYKHRRFSSLIVGMHLGWIGTIGFFFASACVVLLMTSLGVPLDVSTAAITALAVNASVDFALYFMHAYTYRMQEIGDHSKALAWAYDTEGKTITADMFANAAIFAALIVSPFAFEPVRELGLIMVFMLFTAWIGSMIVMPIFLAIAGRYITK